MLPINRSYLNGSARWGTYNDPKYIVVHYTGNANADTALNNVIYMNRIGENAGGSAHYYVDNTSIYQLLEDNWDSWSVGDDNGYGRFAFGINNNNQISIEMCCTSGNYRVSDKTQENCAELVAYLLKKHGLGLDKVRRHYDASRKYCPAQFCPRNTYYPYNDGESNWAKFKQKVAKYYNGGTQTSTTNDVVYRVKLANGTQIGAYKNLDSAKALAQTNKCNVYRSTDNALIVSYVTNPNVANKTINYRVKNVNGVQLGAFNSLENAKALAEKQRAIVYDANNKVVASYVSTTDEISRYSEIGTFYPNTTIYFRNAPDLNSPTQGTYGSGEAVNYDLVVLGKSYNWISWISASTGIRRYMPIRNKATGEKWGYAI